jgi:ADP-ribose pyrophosphatase YjhB (NUDIX family)
VTIYNHRQFITGEVLLSEEFLPDSVYSQALDALVIGCVDVIPIHNGQMLIGLRNWEPQPDWWCFGGRMRKGEQYQIAAARNVRRELFHERDEIEINPDRFNLVGIYNLIWNKRAQKPVQNGCHILSVTMMLSLTDTEIALLRPNEEYRNIRWVLPDEIIQSPHAYHPCLVQMAKDSATQIANTRPG